MVNYRYRLEDIEQNHEKFVHGGEVITSANVRKKADQVLAPSKDD